MHIHADIHLYIIIRTYTYIYIHTYIYRHIKTPALANRCLEMFWGEATVASGPLGGIPPTRSALMGHAAMGMDCRARIVHLRPPCGATGAFQGP